MFIKMIFIIASLLLTIFLSGCGEEIDFYESTPSIFDVKEDDYPAETTDYSSKEKKDSLFDFSTEEYEENTEEITSAQKQETETSKSNAVVNDTLPVSKKWRDTLSEEDKASYDTIYESFMQGENNITIKGTPGTEKISHIYNCITEDYPDIFWIGNGYSITEWNNSTNISFYKLSSIEKDNLNEYCQRLENEVQKILSQVPETGSLYDKILFIHDYIVQNTEYGTDYATIPKTESEMYYNAYGCLVNHRCVCSGYSAAFQLLMQRIGVPCGSTVGFATKNGEAHRWNYVLYEDEYYWVDVTWDDPVTLSESSSSSGTGETSHQFFFITSEELLRTHAIVYESSLFVPECTATKYCYMRYSGNYMENYSFEEFDRMMSRKNGNVIIQFGSREAFVEAMTDLIFNKQIFNTSYFSSNSIYSYSYVSNEEMNTLEIILN